MGIVAEVCHSFVLDNGAFSIWKRGGVLDIAGYVAWVRHWHRHPGFQWALIPDVIDGTVEENDAMVDSWPDDLGHCGVPVWHLNEPVERLVSLGRRFKVVALGSSGEWATPGTKAWWVRMREALNAVCDAQGRPICKLHGLRMLNPKIFTKIPLASADSTNAARNCNQLDRFGMYVAATAWQRAAIIADRTERFNSAPVFERTDAEFAQFIAG